MIHLSVLTSAMASNWRRPNGYDFLRPELYVDIVRALERAKFDGIIFGDTLNIPEVYQGRRDGYVRTGYQAVALDPVTIMGLLAGTTRRIGLGLTMSVTFYPPFLMARIMATLDHLTRGRAAVNIVTATSKAASQNFGFDDLLPHDERYDRGDEYMELVTRLWDSWEPDALVLDGSTGVFARPDKVHAVDFEGKYYRSKGPLTVPSSPQQRPVIFQAGTSPRGRDFAAQHADVVLANLNSVEDMRRYSDDVRARVTRAGRDPKDVKVFCAINPTVGETEVIAREKFQAGLRQAEADMEIGLMALSYALGHDMSAFDLDAPLPPELPVNAIQGKWIQHYGGDRRATLREIAQFEARIGAFDPVGTPEQIADELERAAVDGGVDGFFIRQVLDFDFFLEFIDKVVPVLQRRGLSRVEYTGTTFRDHLFEN